MKNHFCVYLKQFVSTQPKSENCYFCNSFFWYSVFCERFHNIKLYLLLHFPCIKNRCKTPQQPTVVWCSLFPLPLYSVVFPMPSKALCSVPFLPLPRVLFDTPGMLMGQSETLSLRISLWLIFISPPLLRFITSAAYSSRCFVLGFTLCNC